MSSTVSRLERHFEFQRLGTSWKTELLAGVTTFLTMSYIIFVNPSILADAGMPTTAVAAATCISAALGSLMMGLYARYPIALAPGMGINAYFAYSVVLGKNISWETALGAVFLSGVIFLVLTLLGVQQAIVRAIPADLHAAVACGIGLFLALIGLRNAGIIAPSEATMVTLGDLTEPTTVLSIFGLLLTAGLMVRGVRAAMVLGIIGTTLAGTAFGLVGGQPTPYSWDRIGEAAFALDIPGAVALGLLEIIFVFWFVDLFDNVGTLVAVGKKAGLFTRENEIPRIRRILISDGTATVAGALCGTSTVVSYIESAAGVAAGGRSGVTAAVTGLLFLLALFIAPLVGVIPAAATAPALILVGAMMMSMVKEIEWDEPGTSIPAFLTIVAIPLSYSIASGLAIGFIAYTMLKIFGGEFRAVSPLVYVLTALFILRFIYMGGG